MGEIKTEQANVLKFPKHEIKTKTANTGGVGFKEMLSELSTDLHNTEGVMKNSVAGKGNKSFVEVVGQIAETEVKLKATKAFVEKGVGAYKEIMGLNI